MKIQVLGTGCPKCREVTARVERVVLDLGLDVEIEKVESLKDIVAFGVVATPAVAIDGEIRTTGRVPSLDELRELISPDA